MSEILLFGITREIIGSTTLKFSGAESPKNVKELRHILLARYPELKAIASLKVAVNNAFADDDTEIDPKDEVALIPPVSGG